MKRFTSKAVLTIGTVFATFGYFYAHTKTMITTKEETKTEEGGHGLKFLIFIFTLVINQ